MSADAATTTEKKDPITRERIGIIVYGVIGEDLNVVIDSKNEKKNLQEGLGADSLDLTELVMHFEEELGVEIPDDDVEQINTPKKAAVYAMRSVENGKSTKFFLA